MQYREVLFPYLNGEDLNSRPDCSGRRWVINFRDWPIEKAREYAEPFAIVERDVKPERARNSDRRRREIWWRFTRPTLELYEAIADFDRVLVIALVSRLVMPAFVPARQVFAHKLGVFATDRSADLALLSSAFHNQWAWQRSSTMKTDLNYSPSDVYEAFPQATRTERMDWAGAGLHEFRSKLMLDLDLGLTKFYNLVNDPTRSDPEIQRIRELHVEIDEAVLEAYALDEERESAIRDYEVRKAKAPLPAWSDVVLDHGFHDHGQGTRWTIGPQARLDILDKLLVLNHYRHRQEPETGLRKPKKTARARKTTPAATAGPASPATSHAESPNSAAKETDSLLDDGLFPPDGALF
ncbi:hypothetical protein ACSDR0_21940 [Streptosporangium sp. G11]|uniref:hypothetical protein n=1 Tax=Streptosporangium sp. G11 TaxID=3436926 RepID=UPI003EC0E877